MNIENFFFWLSHKEFSELREAKEKRKKKKKQPSIKKVRIFELIEGSWFVWYNDIVEKGVIIFEKF